MKANQTSAADVLLSATAIRLARGSRTLLDGAGLTVRAGQCVALVGPNGAGKSTLLHTVGGLLAADSGQIQVCGRPLAAWTLRQLAQLRAVVGQHSAAAHGLTVADVVGLGLQARGLSGQLLASAIEQVLAEAGLAALGPQSFSVLSGGERQRVHLARALAQLPASGPALLLLDEPTASLDVRQQFAVLQRSRERARQGAGVLAVLHDLNQAAQWADVVVVLEAGRVVATGSPAEVLTAARLMQTWNQPCAVLPHPTMAVPLLVSLP
jgi:iron complex transport system ATP-binding protein